MCYVCPLWRSSFLTSVELHLTSLFTEMNIMTEPSKSCWVKSLPVRNDFKATLFALCFKKISSEIHCYTCCFCTLSHENKQALSPFYYKKYFWQKMKVRYPFLHSFSIKNILYDEMDLFSCDEMKKNCLQPQASIHKYQEDTVWTLHVINRSANLLKVFVVVTAAWEFTITENSWISASFLRADVRYGVGLVIFINCDLLMWYIWCFFFIKHSGKPTTSIWKPLHKEKNEKMLTLLICLSWITCLV